MSKNRAAWILSPTKAFSVSDVPTYEPKAGEVLIKAAAVAVSPIDWKNQDAGTYSSLYPFILGRNTAGTVEDVGKEVTKFYKGQRVIAHLHSPKTGNYANSAFQLYSLASEWFTAAIPDSISFKKSVVLPLSLSTATAGLYLPGYLNLPLPSTAPQTSSKVILGTELIGIYDAISEEQSFTPIKEIVRQLDGTTDEFQPSFVSYVIRYCLPPNERIGKVVWGNFITKGPANGQLQSKPDPLVIGHVLEMVQRGVNLQKAGVSAKKIVVTL
ncbi:chaperonin 10-like protein [Dendryphion nanum]|uniref:Chaperonin 10-like protein n=1 Tax=Dendryphion nanum TaxID=256645 RepID=A0A9P9D4L6_9PLEO|nr:chaperonin 10-like protein [Dendryphion nanum]